MRVPIVILLGLCCSVASAAPTNEKKAAARALINEGNAAFEGKRFKEALERYQRAFDTYPSTKIQFNLGATHEALGEPGAAARSYSRFLSAEREGSSPLRSEAERRLAALSRRLGRVEVMASVRGAALQVDGERVGDSPLGAPLWLEPGPHQLAAHADGFEPAELAFEVQAGSQRRIDLELSPTRPPPAEVVEVAPMPASTDEAIVTSMPAPSDEEVGGRWWLWAGAGVAVVAVGLALILIAGGGGWSPEDTELPASALDEWTKR